MCQGTRPLILFQKTASFSAGYRFFSVSSVPLWCNLRGVIQSRLPSGRRHVSLGQVREHAHSMDYSLRRHYVDQFHIRHMAELAPRSVALDIGGARLAKRGVFDIERYDVRVVYTNVSTSRRPHVAADAATLPFAAGTFHAAICSELLEHVPEPRRVLTEIFRVLRPHGILLACVPFLTRIHGDPYDYGRYTDTYLRLALQAAGYDSIRIERQGAFWSVIADSFRDAAYSQSMAGALKPRALERIAAWGVRRLKRTAIRWDAAAARSGPSWRDGYTTGFGIVARKP